MNSTYSTFIKQRGDLFRYQEIPFDDADRKEVERLGNFSRRITSPFFLSVGILALIGSAYIFYLGSWLPASGTLVGSIAILAFSVYYKSAYHNMLEHGKKISIHGIVTKVQKSGSYHIGLTISERETIFFLKEETQTIQVGDIVQCELISKTENVRNKVERIGNIRDRVDG